jgi:O-antigen/teichoic acid export membrane protein
LGLRKQVIRSGSFLIIRQGLGTVLSLASVIFITRIIGPYNYGVYASAVSIEIVLYNISQLGVGVYLIRSKFDSEENFHQAFSIFILLAGIGLTISLNLLPLLNLWLKMDDFVPIARVLLLGVPLRLLTLVPLAKLERSLAYNKVASVELAGQIVYIGVAIPLAFANQGAWAPVGGWISQICTTTLLFFYFSSYKPKLIWKIEIIKSMLSYSLSYSASIWIWQLRTLVNPLIVGRFLGAEGVAFVSMAIRLADVLSFAKQATWRLSISAFAKIQNDKFRLLKAIEEGMQVQVLIVSPFLLLMTIVGPYLLPNLLGVEWMTILVVFPFIAISYTINSLFNLYASVLFIKRYNWDVAVFHLIHIIIFAGTAIIAVPNFGIIGYGMAELVAFSSYGFLHYRLVQKIGQPRFLLALVWGFAFGFAYFWNLVGWAAFLPLVIVFLIPSSWRILLNLLKLIVGSGLWKTQP